MKKRSRKAKMPGFFVLKEIFAERQEGFGAGQIASVFLNGCGQIANKIFTIQP